jgi:hypothetical protein
MIICVFLSSERSVMYTSIFSRSGTDDRANHQKNGRGHWERGWFLVSAYRWVQKFVICRPISWTSLSARARSAQQTGIGSGSLPVTTKALVKNADTFWSWQLRTFRPLYMFAVSEKANAVDGIVSQTDSAGSPGAAWRWFLATMGHTPNKISLVAQVYLVMTVVLLFNTTNGTRDIKMQRQGGL